MHRSKPSGALASAFHRERLTSVLIALGVFLVNVLVAQRLFVTEYTVYRGSVDGGHIAIARWYLEHFHELGWFPLWYTGIPVENAYQPIQPVLVALTAWLLDITPGLAYHAFTAFAYALAPVTLYWLAVTLSRDRWLSFAAALAYSLVSPVTLLTPLLIADVGDPLGPKRLHSLVTYADSPHVVALALLPSALVAFHHAMRKRSVPRFVLAAAAVAAVVLTNWIAAVTLAFAIGSYMLATIDRDWVRSVPYAAGIGVLAYGLAYRWIPPSTIADVSRNSVYLGGHFPITWVQLALASGLLAVAIVSVALLRSRGAGQLLRFAVPFLVFTSGVTAIWFWFGGYVVPQPSRYHLEADIAFVLVGTFVCGAGVRRLRRRYRIVMTTALCAVALYQLVHNRSYVAGMIQPIAMRDTLEYQAATWIGEHLPDARVKVSGSTMFWLNAFADVSQLGGAALQGARNPTIPVVEYGIHATEGDGERTAMWLRVYGVDAVLAPGVHTRDAYQNYHDPVKFAGVLEELWRSGEDVLYAVPRRSRSLAHVIPRAALVARTPAHVLDVEPVASYDNALENPELPIAAFSWRGPNDAVIETELPEDHLISVQIAYSAGWRAETGGQPCQVTSDGLGFIVLDAPCTGSCTVHLHYAWPWR